MSTQIAHLFSTERLALSFLTEVQKKQFYKQIGDLLKVKNSLKTLSFASYSAAIPTFLKLFPHRTLAKDAHKGLFIFGEHTIPLLTKAVNKAKPDKRPALNKLLGEIERKRGI